MKLALEIVEQNNETITLKKLEFEQFLEYLERSLKLNWTKEEKSKTSEKLA